MIQAASHQYNCPRFFHQINELFIDSIVNFDLSFLIISNISISATNDAILAIQICMNFDALG